MLRGLSVLQLRQLTLVSPQMHVQLAHTDAPISLPFLERLALENLHLSKPLSNVLDCPGVLHLALSESTFATGTTSLDGCRALQVMRVRQGQQSYMAARNPSDVGASLPTELHTSCQEIDAVVWAGPRRLSLGTADPSAARNLRLRVRTVTKQIVIGEAQDLTHVRLCCPSLVAISCRHILTSLNRVNVSGCSSLQSLNFLEGCPALSELRAAGCCALHNLSLIHI
eukprot:TRINITY_DN39896_c0_g1_i3.p1 TRINITY_DN39896_c0_g1~~TRINITY_DN39896_c0_g1_i3.p1  ORF type:complete len:226 (-),score=43.97 TRINITY_DN39896_c0_g1_i3:57-734(-)